MWTLSSASAMRQNIGPGSGWHPSGHQTVHMSRIAIFQWLCSKCITNRWHWSVTRAVNEMSRKFLKYSEMVGTFNKENPTLGLLSSMDIVKSLRNLFDRYAQDWFTLWRLPSHSTGSSLYSEAMLAGSFSRWSSHDCPKKMSAAYVWNIIEVRTS